MVRTVARTMVRTVALVFGISVSILQFNIRVLVDYVDFVFGI